MRVTHVITRLIVGGAQENTIESVLRLRTRPGLEVTLISGPTQGPEGSLEDRFDDTPGVLTILPELVRPVHPWKDWIALRKLTALFRQTQPHIVHTHSGKAGVLGRAAAHRARVPMIVHTIHGPSFGAFQGTLANAVFTVAERYAARFTTQFVVVAEAMARQYVAAGVGQPENFIRIFSGFPLEPFLSAQNDPELRSRLGIQPGDYVVGMIARLFRLKGHDDLFDAAPALVKACPLIKFLLIGGGEWRERFEQRAGELGVQRHFIFAGLVPPEAVPRYIGVMDVLVHLSRREGLARALPQALAAGKPVVAYDCDGANEVCFNNETGFLIQPGNQHALIENLVQLARNPELRGLLGERGRVFVRERFSLETMIEQLEGLYRRLAKRS